jgi:Transposase IS4
MWGVVEVVALE